ncbi:MAG: DUF3098 domain-containing protein [Flavobacteriales bacterium]|jgi:hypothetical protein|nr:DUF3098 domain-containing protein [Flavobacteriales bacterium]NCG30776.1 DUF3098 domain-containing protein [Bacteroidota bacterium]MBT3964288.1 DUF3098 domain-containing protein [Flavobacteriales bacterium]MBT4705578.1 DUF3098 domain-containing protein [Flavobacteriales bacterium]MBT4931117.1 DUF3098 domain-containing protein [Flavobacteriales bacterium]
MSDTENNKDFPLERQNFMFIGIGMLVVIVGFFLMSGGGADDTTSFNPDIFNVRRMFIAPIAIVTGYGLVMWGIIKK